MNRDELFPRRKKIHLADYDYSTVGNYFVTIVTQNRHCLFGRIVDGEMMVNGAGKAVGKALEDISLIYSPSDILYYVVMPNHIHFIISLFSDVSLHEIIRRFKSCTTHLYIKGVGDENWLRFDKRLWQRDYYEHIIRNQRAYDYIVNYIVTNPARWNKDAINPQHDIDKEEIMKQVLLYDSL